MTTEVVAMLEDPWAQGKNGRCYTGLPSFSCWTGAMLAWNQAHNGWGLPFTVSYSNPKVTVISQWWLRSELRSTSQWLLVPVLWLLISVWCWDKCKISACRYHLGIRVMEVCPGLGFYLDGPDIGFQVKVLCLLPSLAPGGQCFSLCFAASGWGGRCG
jgi:hypothetical protein